jgi:hypothetical protein
MMRWIDYGQRSIGSPQCERKATVLSTRLQLRWWRYPPSADGEPLYKILAM